jgi:DNA sulfur modification protein DndD
LDEVQNDLKESFDFIPFALTGTTMLDISSQLEMENIFRSNKTQIDNVEDKIYEIINDLEQEREKAKIPFESRVHDFYSNQIRRLIKKYFYSEVSEIPLNFSPLHDFSDSETNEFNGLISNLSLSFKETFKRINSEYNSIKNELRTVQVKIREAEKNQDNPFIAELRQKKDKLDYRILQIEAKIEEINVEIGKLETEIKTSEARKTDLSKKIEVSKKNKEKDEEARKLIACLKDFIIKFKEEKKKSLEMSIFEGLSTLMHKKDFISKVVVDISMSGNDIDINLFKNQQGKEIKVDKETLSKGEQQLYATALLKALVEESEIEFPVFIDSPMQKFDDEHSQNIIKHFYPNISDQVVILPLINKEINEKEYNSIKSKISRAFIIHNLDSDRSEFLAIEPNLLIEKYNELYNYAN